MKKKGKDIDERHVVEILMKYICIMLRIRWNWHEGFVGADRFIGLALMESAFVYAYIDLWEDRISKKMVYIWQIRQRAEIFNILQHIRGKFFFVDHVCCFPATYRAFLEKIFFHSLIVYSRREDFSSMPQGEKVRTWRRRKENCFVYLTKGNSYSLNDLHRICFSTWIEVKINTLAISCMWMSMCV